MRVALVALLLLAVFGGVGYWAFGGEAPPAPSTAAPTTNATAAAAVEVAGSERKALELPAVVDESATAARAPSDGGEDGVVRTAGDEAFARKYAHRTRAELEAAFDELGQAWQEERTAAVDAALAAGNYSSSIVAPNDLDATVRELTDEARKSGDLFTSRTVPYGQGVMLEVQFVRVGRAGFPQLFARADEVRWLEAELERTRRNDDER
ncbi:MAG: hypothetical protein K8S98_11800 [Planctomycetes bacterium]|nr:hypothetical protein [Planctomycetota bacterium]